MTFFGLYCGENVSFLSLVWGEYLPLLVFIVGKMFAFFGLYCGEIMCLLWSLLWGKYVHSLRDFRLWSRCK